MSSVEKKSEERIQTKDYNEQLLKKPVAPLSHKRYSSENFLSPKQNDIFVSRRQSNQMLLNVQKNDICRFSFDSGIKSPLQKKQEMKIKQKQIQELMKTQAFDFDSDIKDKDLNNLNKKEYTDLKINAILNQIRDLSDKTQIHEAIKMLDNKEERSLLIDKILIRKQEKQNADQIIQISKVQPLVNRFMRKIKKDSSELEAQTIQKIIKDQQSTKNMSTDNTLLNVNEIQQDKQSELQIEDITSRNSFDKSTLSVNKSKIIEATIESKAMFLSIFSNLKKKEEPQNVSKISQISAYNESFQKISSNGKKINLNKVSENSIDLINKGRENAKQKANELLKDVQKQSLASHFKSFSLKNRFDSKSQNASKDTNTFQNDVVEKQMNKEKEKMNNYINYQNHLEASRVVSNEVVKYFDKYQKDLDEFILYPKIIPDQSTRSIEYDIQKSVQQLKGQRSPQTTKNEYHPNTWRNQSSGCLSFANLQRQASQQNYFRSQKYNQSNQHLEDFPPYLTTRSRISQVELINDYQYRKSQTISRGRAKSPPNITKGFQTPRSVQCSSPTSPYNMFTQDIIMTTPQGKNNLSQTASTFKTSKSRFKSPEENYVIQKDRMGIEKRKYFSYCNESDFLQEKTNKEEVQDILESKDEKIKNKKKEDFMRTFENNKQINQKIKNVKTVNKWKLDGSIHFIGEDKQDSLNESLRNDDSLVSFTEIKLDKLYKQTHNIQNQQKFLERMQQDSSQILQKYHKDLYEKTTDKHKRNLISVKNDILHTTSYKLKSGGKFSLNNP